MAQGYYLLNSGKPPTGFDASHPISDEAERALAEQLRGLRDEDWDYGVESLASLLQRKGLLFKDIAEEMLPLTIKEYERRLRDAAAEHGSSMVRREPVVEIWYSKSGQLEATVEMDEGRWARGVKFLTDTLKPLDEAFGASRTLHDMASDWLWALAAAVITERAAPVGAPGPMEDALEQACAFLARREAEPYRSMVRWLALDLSERFFDWSTWATQGLEILVGLEQTNAPQESPLPALREEHLLVPSAAIYAGFQSAIVEPKRFGVMEGSRYPVALVDAAAGHTGRAIMLPLQADSGLLPPEQVEYWAGEMWRQRERLSDLEADVLDAMIGLWLKRSRYNNDRLAYVRVEELLGMRGIQEKKGGDGRRGGFEPEQRAAIIGAVVRLQNMWLDMGEMEIFERSSGSRPRKVRKTVRSRAIVVSDVTSSPRSRLDNYAEPEGFVFRPGEAFRLFLDDVGRQMTLLSVRALGYDYKKQKWEKRLARTLSWRWRIGATRNGQYWRPYSVQQLLQAAQGEVDERNPSRTRRRLEKVLDTLKADGVVADWQYDRYQDPLRSPRKGWVKDWLGCTIIIEPPDVVKDLCALIEESTPKRGRKNKPLKLSEAGKDHAATFGDRLKAARKRKAITQMVLADRIIGDCLPRPRSAWRRRCTTTTCRRGRSPAASRRRRRARSRPSGSSRAGDCSSLRSSCAACSPTHASGTRRARTRGSR